MMYIQFRADADYKEWSSDSPINGRFFHLKRKKKVEKKVPRKKEKCFFLKHGNQNFTRPIIQPAYK